MGTCVGYAFDKNDGRATIKFIVSIVEALPLAITNSMRTLNLGTDAVLAFIMRLASIEISQVVSCYMVACFYSSTMAAV